MPTATSTRHAEPWRPRLYLPAYNVVDAARYARTRAGTVRNWHYGASSLGPVIPDREHGKPLSYLELVEVAFVATFRRLGVPLQRIRRARAYAAQVLKAEFPFAELRFKTEGAHLLLDLQELEPEASFGRVVFADSEGQTAWGDMVSDRFMEFEYVENLALVWHVRGSTGQVLIDPRVAFGAPMIAGIPTWVVKGRYEAGESVGEIGTDFGLDGGQVKEALDFEGIQLQQTAA